MLAESKLDSLNEFSTIDVVGFLLSFTPLSCFNWFGVCYYFILVLFPGVLSIKRRALQIIGKGSATVLPLHNCFSASFCGAGH